MKPSRKVPLVNRFILSLPILCFWLSACGVDQDFLRFSLDAEDETSTASGGASSEGPDAGQGGVQNPYEKGGYGGRGIGYAFFVAEGGIGIERNSSDFCTGGDRRPISSWSSETCRAGTLCSLNCNVDADCAALDGPLDARCSESPSYRRCLLPCEADSDCLEGMICETDVSAGKSCMFPETPWSPGCDSFCLEEQAAGLELCGVDADCCVGLSCSPEGECQDRECLPASWQCESEGVPCCDGTSCQNGHCQP